MRIGIINGPNLNLLGKRQPEVYGHQSFEDYLPQLQQKFPEVTFNCYQSNSEDELISAVQKMGESELGIVLNPGAYTHTSIALADAVASVSSPVVEVHLSNISAREFFRNKSYLTPQVAGSIMGFGLKGYQLAVSSLLKP